MKEHRGEKNWKGAREEGRESWQRERKKHEEVKSTENNGQNATKNLKELVEKAVARR